MEDHTLVQAALDEVSSNFHLYRHQLHNLPATIVCDILYNISKKEIYPAVLLVKTQLSPLPTFLRLLNARQKWQQLLRIFQAIHEKDLHEGLDDNNPLLSESLATAYVERCDSEEIDPNVLFKEGLLLGEFLLLSGWFLDSATVLQLCFDNYLVEDDNFESWIKSLECLEKLLIAQSFYNLVKESVTTYQTSCAIVEKLKSMNETICATSLSKIYNAFSIYHYSENRYEQALRWSIEALRLIGKTEIGSLDYTLVVDVLRQTATCCSVKREIGKAKLLITKAMCLARDVFGSKSVKYTDVLIDYGYFLINSDNVQQGVEVYQEAVQIRQDAFGVYNLITAIAMSELSYALYVHEYNTGKFDMARHYSELALDVMGKLLPKEHLVIVSANRVIALILEEIAIDNAGSPSEQELLKEAEKLHISCLEVTTQVHGEMNVQTAKHYGNLGRLYQTMKKFHEAESMHLKAISIKEAVLGDSDYEVALSVGHLASLYNYDLREYNKAEQLHLRSIRIGQRLFGEAYSGLEYDYRGLLQVYLISEQMEKYAEYSRILARWKLLQDMKKDNLESEQGEGKQLQCHQPLSAVVKNFFELDWQGWTEV